MKALLPLTSLSILICSCSTPLTGETDTSSFDPLGSPLDKVKIATFEDYSAPRAAQNQDFQKGALVETVAGNASFYTKYPRFSNKGQETLPPSTHAEVLSYKGEYTKVKLDSGSTGYIPSRELLERATPVVATVVEELAAEGGFAPPTETEILERIKARETLPAPTLDLPIEAPAPTSGVLIKEL